MGHFADELFDKLRALDLPDGEYAVFGSGPLAIRGLIERVGDLDVLARGEAWERVRDLGEIVLVDGDETIDLGNGLHFGRGWGYGDFDVDALIADAENIEGIPFVRLGAVIEYKVLAGRPQDLQHLVLLKDAGLVD